MTEDTSPIDFDHDSSRLITNGTRVKCIVIMDVTPLNEEGRDQFAKQAMAALTRMGDKIMNPDKE